MARVFGLSENDRRKVQELLDARTRQALNTTGRTFQTPEEPQAPEVYIAIAPDGGVPALSRVGSGTGSGMEDEPGTAACAIYRIRHLVGSSPQLTPVGLYKTVYNLRNVAVSPGEWCLVVRDKFGHWIVAEFDSSSGGGSGSTAITVEAWDGSPSYPTTDTLVVYEPGGLTISQPGAGMVLLDISAATPTQAGSVSTAAQSWAGIKTFTEGLVSETYATVYLGLVVGTHDSGVSGAPYDEVKLTVNGDVVLADATGGSAGRSYNQYFGLPHGAGSVTDGYAYIRVDQSPPYVDLGVSSGDNGNPCGVRIGSGAVLLYAASTLALDLQLLTLGASYRGAYGIDPAGNHFVAGVCVEIAGGTNTGTGTLGPYGPTIDNFELSDMPAWTIKARNAASAGVPQDVACADLSEELPDTGDFLVGFLAGGELCKFDVGSLFAGTGALGSVDGSGTADYLAAWVDVNTLRTGSIRDTGSRIELGKPLHLGDNTVTPIGSITPNANDYVIDPGDYNHITISGSTPYTIAGIEGSATYPSRFLVVTNAGPAAYTFKYSSGASSGPIWTATLADVVLPNQYTAIFVKESGYWRMLGPVTPASITIGDPVNGGTANRVLFVDSGGDLSDDAGFTFDASTNTLTVSSGFISCPSNTSGEHFGEASVAGDRSTSVGKEAECGSDAVALGYQANADGVGAALGKGTDLQTNTGVALGNGSKLTTNYQFVCGSVDMNITDVYFGLGQQHGSNITVTLHGTDQANDDSNGSPICVAGGRGRGTGTGGSILLKTAPAGSSGSTPGTLTTQVEITHDALVKLTGGVNIECGVSSGSSFGTGTSQLVGMHGSTAVQHSSTGETTGFTAGSGTPTNDDSTYTGNVGSTAYTVGDIVKALKNKGIMAS